MGSRRVSWNGGAWIWIGGRWHYPVGPGHVWFNGNFSPRSRSRTVPRRSPALTTRPATGALRRRPRPTLSTTEKAEDENPKTNRLLLQRSPEERGKGFSATIRRRESPLTTHEQFFWRNENQSEGTIIPVSSEGEVSEAGPRHHTNHTHNQTPCAKKICHRRSALVIVILSAGAFFIVCVPALPRGGRSGGSGSNVASARG